jgi:hypothetical protein
MNQDLVDYLNNAANDLDTLGKWFLFFLFACLLGGLSDVSQAYDKYIECDIADIKKLLYENYLRKSKSLNFSIFWILGTFIFIIILPSKEQMASLLSLL